MKRKLLLKDMHKETVMAGGVPEYVRSKSIWMCAGYGKVDITELVFRDGLEVVIFSADLHNQKYKGTNWEELDNVLEVHDCQLGDGSDDDVISLTPLGEQEVALLSSLPYLFHENPETGL